MNENGQRMLELCCHHCLCVNNVFFKTKHHHRVSWIHPRSNHWQQLDYILSRNTVKLVLFLQEASLHSQFEAWIQEKLQIATDESFRDLTNVQRKLQRHQAFEAEIAANKNGFDSINAVNFL